ncbi:MAG: hypothetical protein EOO63_06615 [Hymenobacter sp.]|nr:MAG: hypothetical protein EOO63_06615 [Hymenobacter sp.]
MSQVVELTRWYGPDWRGYAQQLVPTSTELLAAGAVATGEYAADYGDPADTLPPGRDARTWYVESPCRAVTMLLVPDKRGFYVEDGGGDRWRPSHLAELVLLLQALALSSAQFA